MFDETKEAYNVFGEEVRDMVVVKNGENATLTIIFKNNCPMEDIIFTSKNESIDHIVNLLSDNPDTCYHIKVRDGELYHVSLSKLFDKDLDKMLETIG